MATVSRVVFDVTNYQSFLYDLPESELRVDDFLFNGTSKLASWLPKPIYSDRPRLAKPDIWHLFGAAVMVMFEPTIESLQPFVAQAGELLPLKITDTGETAFALNVLDDIDCLDKKESQLDDPTRRFLSFAEHRLPEEGLFKVPEYDTVDIYVVEWGDDDRSFRRAIETNALQGISLTPIWSTKTGVIPFDLALS